MYARLIRAINIINSISWQGFKISDTLLILIFLYETMVTFLQNQLVNKFILVIILSMNNYYNISFYKPRLKS
jgi:hypothetical protein